MPGSTPIYGFPYPLSTDLVANYPALGLELATDVETVLPTLAGVTLISPTSIANSGGTATSTSGTTTFTGVTSISLNGVFSADYQNYLVSMTVTVSTAADLYMRYRASGADISLTNYVAIHNRVLANTATTLRSPQATNSGNALTLNEGVTESHNAIAVYSPFLSSITRHHYSGAGWVSNEGHNYWGGGIYNAATSITGLSIYPASGNITGKIRVYGYKGA